MISQPTQPATQPLNVTTAKLIKLPAPALPRYRQVRELRARLVKFLEQADELGADYSGLRIASDGANASSLVCELKRRLSAVRTAIKRARYNERRRAAHASEIGTA